MVVAVVYRATILQTVAQLQGASRLVYLPAFKTALVSLAGKVLAGGTFS